MLITGKHILVFPYPAQGHMIPLLDLTHQLAIQGVYITILVTPQNLPSLTSLLSAHPKTITALVLPFPSHPDIPPGIENTKDLPGDGFKTMMMALGDLYNPVLDWFQKNPTPPSAILSDMFLGWTYHLACHLGIRHYTFAGTSAFSLSVIYSLWRYKPKRDDQGNENEMILFPNMPNSPEFPWWKLSIVYRTHVKGDPHSEFIKRGLCNTMASRGIIINSFSELEQVYFDHLKEEVGHDRVFAVGPILPTGNKGMRRGGSSSNDVLSWLDKCGNEEVVYICFGSQSVLTNDQMEVVARSLEKSQVKFVWSVKKPTIGHVAGKYGRIPNGFEDRVTGRGLIVRGWAPQVEILRHDSVGAFLTHCGWNSIMEAVEAEVLMLTWPMTADQHTNASLLHELKVGIRACAGAETIPDSGELAELFSKTVSKETRIEKELARKFGRTAKQAIGENGSSMKELDRLVASFAL
uniref:UDP-glycosyltransferase 89B2-like n=1 Tax=Erigeron canadensis TaxID=72917 RepID=UPI001CB94617|nr:UDP-glycosyltransferase 89B2-like [Erigeron canadensis]